MVVVRCLDDLPRFARRFDRSREVTALALLSHVDRPRERRSLGDGGDRAPRVHPEQRQVAAVDDDGRRTRDKSTR